MTVILVLQDRDSLSMQGPSISFPLLLADQTLHCWMYPAATVAISQTPSPGMTMHSSSVQTLVHCVVKCSRPHDIKSASRLLGLQRTPAQTEGKNLWHFGFDGSKKSPIIRNDKISTCHDLSTD